MSTPAGSDPNELAFHASFGPPEDPMLVASAFALVLTPARLGWHAELYENVDEGFGFRQIERGVWWRSSRELARRKGLREIRHVIRRRIDRFDAEQRAIVFRGEDAYR